MKRIIIHWTAGGYYPTTAEKEVYHFLVDKDGKVYNGKFAPENNLKCVKGCYAAHTGGGNTASIGVAICAMAGFKNKNSCGAYPIKPMQFEAAMKLCADLALKYKIPVSASTVMTHYEFGMKNPNTSSAGKIDITYLPPYPWVDKNDAGSFIRSKIKWYISKAKEV
ncbi:N-acetylmuramoyl-L-alanine amidase [bacterium]|uniref:N-acetylmuramoyl-L-alanine amidase n=1 Tax=Candidatus Scatenecus faecavium TaxID=2840915 RepID=A0A9D1FVQ1_9BACT|nr:N-acetylmuramoyl-L-alanine amidase [bacterium]HIS82361.1 N-acetylmuramoyl-L-alanine amidase [Candidatus Scatenecus faecavium]